MQTTSQVESHRAEVEAFRESYRRVLTECCGDDKPKIPFGYLRGSNPENDRVWDYFMMMKYGGISAADSILEVGAMNTFFCVYVSKICRKITATDSFDWTDRAFAKDFFSPNEWRDYLQSKARNLRAEQADIESLKYENDSFDKIISVSTHEHVRNDAQGMSELLRVLKPGGVLLMTTEYNEKGGMAYSDSARLRIYGADDIPKLMQGFDIEHTACQLTAEQVEVRRPFKITPLFVKAIKPSSKKNTKNRKTSWFR